MVASSAATRETAATSRRHHSHGTGNSSSWANHSGPVETATTYQRALEHREERIALENHMLSLATRVRDLEMQVRDQKEMMGEVAANADKRVTELLWEAEALEARDGAVMDRLERLKGEIADKKRLVAKEFAGYIPKEGRIDFFKLSEGKPAGGEGSPTKTGSGNISKSSTSPKTPREHRWQQEIIKRAGQRAVKAAQLKERSEALREEMRGGNAPPPGTSARNDLAGHIITREAWLRAHAEQNTAELEDRLREKELELRALDKSIARQKKVLKEQKKLDKIHDEELPFSKPTHRHDRVPRHHVNIAGTREVDFLQQALHCIMVDPNETIRSSASMPASARLSAVSGQTGEMSRSFAGSQTSAAMAGRWRGVQKAQQSMSGTGDVASTVGVAQELTSPRNASVLSAAASGAYR